jgi:hypothetical protein
MLTVTAGLLGDITALFSGNALGAAATTRAREVAEAFSPFVEGRAPNG